MTDLPVGWAKTTLSDVIEVTKEKGIPSNQSEFPFIGMEHIASNSGEILTYGDPADYKSGAVIADESLVLYGRLRPYLNKVFIPKSKCFASGEFIPLKPKDLLDRKYLLNLLRSSHFVSFAVSLNAGDRPRVKWEQMRNYAFDLPPLAEQERIVEILEEQFSRLDSALASVKAVREKAKAFRRSLLHAAFSGELTGGTEGWREVTLGDLFTLVGGFAYKSSSWVSEGIPVVKIGNVRNGKVTLEGCSYVTEKDSEDAERYGAKYGDLLMTLTGEIGAVGVYREPVVARVNQRVARVDIKNELVVGQQLIVMLLSSPQIKEALERKAKGVAQPNISPKDVMGMRTQLPSPPIQKRIVSLLEEQLSRLDNALKVANQLETRIASERRSLLHSAFSGALTATWRETHV